MPGSGQYDIRLKLLSENNVILAKCDGLETEVFMPALIDGRISVVNVIPQRRCDCISTLHLVGKKTRTGQAEASPSDTLSKWRVPMSTQKKKKTVENEPLAKSTPAQLKARNAKERTINISCPSPEPMRHALPELNTTFIAPMSRNQKQLQFNDSEINQSDFRARSLSLVSRDFSTADNQSPMRNLSEIVLPHTSPVVRQENANNNTIGLTYIESPKVPEWRKVITPVRTYARRKHQLNTTLRPLTDEVPKHYLENRTMAPTVSHQAILKKRKLIVDQKSVISPKSFKQQIKTEPVSLQKKQLHTKNFIENLSRKSAFELLTNLSNKSNCIAKSLQEQFRRRCVNKGSSTYPKYKKLCAVEPIENKTSLIAKDPSYLTNDRNRELEPDTDRRQQRELTCNRAQTTVQTISSSSSQSSYRYIIVSEPDAELPTTSMASKKGPRKILIYK